MCKQAFRVCQFCHAGYATGWRCCDLYWEAYKDSMLAGTLKSEVPEPEDCPMLSQKRTRTSIGSCGDIDNCPSKGLHEEMLKQRQRQALVREIRQAQEEREKEKFAAAYFVKRPIQHPIMLPVDNSTARSIQPAASGEQQDQQRKRVTFALPPCHAMDAHAPRASHQPRRRRKRSSTTLGDQQQLRMAMSGQLENWKHLPTIDSDREEAQNNPSVDKPGSAESSKADVEHLSPDDDRRVDVDNDAHAPVEAIRSTDGLDFVGKHVESSQVFGTSPCQLKAAVVPPGLGQRTNHIQDAKILSRAERFMVRNFQPQPSPYFRMVEAPLEVDRRLSELAIDSAEEDECPEDVEMTGLEYTVLEYLMGHGLHPGDFKRRWPRQKPRRREGG